MLKQAVVFSCAILLSACQSIPAWEALKTMTVGTETGKHAGSTDAAAKISNSFITLGTRGGPVQIPNRSQPANVLINGDDIYLVDVGDGASGQLVKTGIGLRSVDGIFISHLHFDHTGGLAAVLGLRYQTSANEPITVYGPPGTRETVEGIFAAMEPEMRVGYAVPGARKPPTPQEQTIVVEVSPDAPFELGDMTVTAVENTHFSLPEGSEAAKLNKSYAFRFDMPDRSIVFTGDTGPSKNVEKLAQGADLLVSEMMDISFIIENLKKDNAKRPRPVPEKNLEGVFRHLREHHVTAEQVGEMAARANVKEVVVTHFAGKDDKKSIQEYIDAIAVNFDGKAVIANDLDKF